MKGKVEGKLYKMLGLKSIEENHLTERNGKWLILTTKASKDQVKHDVEKILSGLTQHILTPGLSQPKGIQDYSHIHPLYRRRRK